eukprot:FR743784.1.p1 GENE.FR743784.1~~FR743784.1.p1  ORF type:complete len:191 (+),score=25.93 FR743784.1:27-575(+)
MLQGKTISTNHPEHDDYGQGIDLSCIGAEDGDDDELPIPDAFVSNVLLSGSYARPCTAPDAPKVGAGFDAFFSDSIHYKSPDQNGSVEESPSSTTQLRHQDLTTSHNLIKRLEGALENEREVDLLRSKMITQQAELSQERRKIEELEAALRVMQQEQERAVPPVPNEGDSAGVKRRVRYAAT